MAKKSDILLNYYNEFPDYLQEYKTRSKELERNFLRAKNDYASYLKEIEEDFSQKENKLEAKYYQIELIHHEKNHEITVEFKEQLQVLIDQVEKHNEETFILYNDENNVYQEILKQFEDRKAEAFKTYLKLTKVTDYRINREMLVHYDFISDEKEKLDAKKIEYQDLNSTLSNKLLWTMEKAKNALSKLSTTLNEEGKQNKNYLDETINDSLRHLNNSKEAMMALFKTTSRKFDEERNAVNEISRSKRRPHSELNQKMISSFVKQIREVNKTKENFERIISSELELSLSRVYPKIIEADAQDNLDDLKKYILQKEIIEKKVDYLLNRNQTLSDILISKYQSEIKKIKIDSFKRYEEIRNAYSVPVAFFQNSVNVYSNFAFYLNETYEDLYVMLNKFKQYNADYIKYKTDYIHNSQKSFEDYKINLLVKVNEITNHLTEYISKIDNLSNQIVTLESNNRLEIAEIKKKMENLDVFGDYQKYIASLETDFEIAEYQHTNNSEKIRIEANYTNNLLDINREVLLLNQNKLDYEEYQAYMINLSEQEKEIQELAFQRKVEEEKAKYQQKIDQVVSLRELAKNQIIYNANKTNYSYASSYVDYLNTEDKKHRIGSEKVIDFVHHVQNLININQTQTNQINEYIKETNDELAYLKALENNREDLIAQVDKTTFRKNNVCQSACFIYEAEISDIGAEFSKAFNKYLGIFKNHLLLLQSIDTSILDIQKHNGYRTELSCLFGYAYKKTITLAYKYQIPKKVIDIDIKFEDYLGRFMYKNIQTFKKLKNQKNSKKVKNLLRGYFVESYTLVSEFQSYIEKTLEIILANSTKSDRVFIENTFTKANKTKNIINKEYERLEFYAIKHQKSQRKQLKHYNKYSKRLDSIYKKQVEDINVEYLKQVNESDNLANEVYKNFVKIINKNNKELKQMTKFMDKMFTKEQKLINKQYAKFKKSLSTIKTERETYHSQEISHIKALYLDKNTEANKTILVLENKITSLPVEKKNQYLRVKKQKYELQTSKAKALQKSLAQIEKEKYMSRPKYLNEIENVKKRLPEDYIKLYGQIQSLESEFLGQFYQINNEYTENYQNYLENQQGNNALLENDSALYQGFEDLHNFNAKMIKSTIDTYKETKNKSTRFREKLKKEKQQSQSKQDRIINV